MSQLVTHAMGRTLITVLPVQDQHTYLSQCVERPVQPTIIIQTPRRTSVTVR